MSRVRVEVTPESIAEGVRTIPSLCPIALALKPFLAESLEAAVDLETGDPGGAWVEIWRLDPEDLEAAGELVDQLDLPPAAAAWECAYYRGEAVSPFAFEIEVPDDVLRVEVAP